MTDMITVSRKEVESLQRWQDDEEIANNCYEDDDGCFILYDDLRALLDKAEVSEPVASDYVENLEAWIIKNMPVGTVIGDPKWWSRKIHNVIAFTSPPDQSAKIAELEAEIARLNAIIGDMKVIDNVFWKGK